MTDLYVKRIIQIYEFDNGLFDAIDSQLRGERTATRVTDVDRDAVYEFINERLYPKSESDARQG